MEMSSWISLPETVFVLLVVWRGVPVEESLFTFYL